MDKCISTLKIRYDAVLQSPTDSLFYQNIHAYIDIIVKIPELSAIIDKSEEDYSIKHYDLWHPHTKDESELDWREAETYRLEHFSLYATHFCMLLVRIYWPIEYYKNPFDEDDRRPDPVVMLMLRGFDTTLKMNLWDKKHIKVLNGWFDGNRKRYENDIRQFHADFLTELYKITDKPVEKSDEVKINKIPLAINTRTGDFHFFKTSGSFSPVSQEFKVLRTLYEDKDCQASFQTLLQSYMPNLDHVGKAHKDSLYQIIRNIKEKLGILPASDTSNPDIFKTVKGLGYRLSLSPDETGAE